MREAQGHCGKQAAETTQGPSDLLLSVTREDIGNGVCGWLKAGSEQEVGGVKLETGYGGLDVRVGLGVGGDGVNH